MQDDLDRAAAHRLYRKAAREALGPDDVYYGALMGNLAQMFARFGADLTHAFLRDAIEFAYAIPPSPAPPMRLMAEKYAYQLGALAVPYAHLVFACVLGLAGMAPRYVVEPTLTSGVTAMIAALTGSDEAPEAPSGSVVPLRPSGDPDGAA